MGKTVSPHWAEMEKVVILRLDTHDKALEDLKRTIDKNTDTQIEILKAIEGLKVGLKIKSGVWGAIAGLIPAALMLLYFILKGG